MSEQIEMQAQEDYTPLPAPLKTRVQLAGTALVVGEVANLFAHGGLPGFAMAGLAAYVAWRHSGDVSEAVRKRYSSLDPKAQASLAGFMNWARGNSAYLEDVPELAINEEVEEVLVSPKPPEREGFIIPGDDGQSFIAWDDDDDEVPMPTVQQGGFTLSQVLARGFRPDLQHIYLGTLDDGSDVIVPVEDLCHVALAGLTGNGKGNIMRLVMSQLCSIGVRVLLLNPHYAGYDQSGGEDWTPFEGMDKKGEPYLQQPPLPCSEETTIAMYLEWMAQKLIPQRKALAQEYKPIGRPYFVVVDEWPDVVKECAKKKINVVEHLEKILREGRKYGVYVVVASQDFQVKTIGVESGGVRKCFKTVLYVGGDRATANALLGDDVTIPEKLLGKGVVMLRCKSVMAQVARVPYVDNDALYKLLGPSQLPSHILHGGVKVTTPEEELPSVTSKVTGQVQKLQAPLQELHGNNKEEDQVSFEELCYAVAEMAALHYKNGEIIRMLDLTDEEYQDVIEHIKAHREIFFPLRPTSQKRGAPTSSPTSQYYPRLQLVNSPEVAQEVARSSREVRNTLEVEEEALSERELRIAQMFYEEKIGINGIMKELYPGVVGGTPYQKGNSEIMEALRKYTDAQKSRRELV